MEKTAGNKRKTGRHDTKAGYFALFRRDSSVLPGLIINISTGGLAFFYHEDEDWPINNTELFYIFGDNYNVENVSLITTYDSEVTDTSHPVYQILAEQKNSQVKIRRRGVKFGTLSREQEEDIEALTNEYRAHQSDREQ